MAKPSTLNRILVMLCLLAIPCAQLFGVRKIYHCDCSGSFVAMQEDRCFGVNGQDCHAEEENDHSEHGEEDSHKHEEAQDTFRTSVFSLKPVALPEPVLLDALRLQSPRLRAIFSNETSVRLEMKGDPPPAQLPFRHCILLI